MWKNFYVVDLILYGFGLLCCVVRLVCVVIFWRLFARFVLVLLILMFLCVLEVIM